MKLIKKAMISTLAVGMTAASLASVVPTSKGITEAFGLKKAAAAGNFDDITGQLDAVYKKLDDAGRAALKALRDDLQSISKQEFETALSPILSKLPDTVSSDTLYSFFKASASLSYDPSYENLSAIRTNPDYIQAAKAIGAAGGIDGLSVDDLTSFGISAQQQLGTIVGNKTLTELLALLDNEEARNQLVRDAYRQTLNIPAGQGNSTFGAVLSTIGINENDVASAIKNVQKELDPTVVKNAVKSLGLAYIASGAATPKPPATGGDTGGGTPGGGTPGGTTPGGGSGNSGGGSPGSGGTGAPAPAIPSPPLVLEADGTLDISGSVKITEGQATVSLDQSKVLAAIKAAEGKEVLTLDLKNVNASAISVPLNTAILEAAKAAGVENIAVKVNGLTLSLPIGQFDGALDLAIAKKEDSEVTKAVSAPLASDVYEFGLKVAGKDVSAFRQPVQIKIPLRNTSADPELLTVVKIVNEKAQIEGGMVEGQAIVESRNTFSTYAVIENKVSFNDISGVQSWAGRQIEVAAAKGAVEGKSAGTFAPKDAVTRAEFAKMLVHAFDLENQFASSAFGDVEAGKWFAPYVAAAADKGIITGRSADKFVPQATITRAEMATMVARTLKLVHKLDDASDANAVLSQFSDSSSIPASLREGTAFAAANNLVIGNDGKFVPAGNATRAEAAVILYRAMNFKSGK